MFSLLIYQFDQHLNLSNPVCFPPLCFPPLHFSAHIKIRFAPNCIAVFRMLSLLVTPLMSENASFCLQHISAARGTCYRRTMMLWPLLLKSVSTLYLNLMEAELLIAFSCSTLGKPDLFITMACNPNWPAIKDALYSGQAAWQRPDLVSRVFRLKFKQFLKDILVGQCFGRVLGHIAVIEFQKRGLPHAHMCFVLADCDKPRTVEDYDRFTCAELPPADNPQLRALVCHLFMLLC